MYKRLIERSIRSTFERFNEGDIASVTSRFADTAHFTFPGASTWALDTRDPAEIREWFANFVELRPHVSVIDVWVKGWVWDLQVAVRMEDRIGDRYSNDVFQYLRVRWGRIVRDQLYLDTEAVAGFTPRE